MKVIFLVGLAGLIGLELSPSCRAEEMSDNSHCNLDYIRSVMQNSCRRLPRLRQLRRQLRHAAEGDSSGAHLRGELRFFSDNTYEAIPVRRHRGPPPFGFGGRDSRDIREQLQVPEDVLLMESTRRRHRRQKTSSSGASEGSRSDPHYYFKFCCRNKTICEQLTCTH